MRASGPRRAASPKVVLGVNPCGHDAAAVLLVEGRAAFAASEERFDRVKGSGAFPRRAIAAALEHAGVEPGEVGVVALPWTRGMARARKAWHVARGWPRTKAFLREPQDVLGSGRRDYLANMARAEDTLAELGIEAPVQRVPHHRAHAASARLVLPDGEGLVLTADGMGEWSTATTWLAANGLQSLRKSSFPHSAGKAYAAVTQWLGFTPERDEGKTMGLAGYGDPSAAEARALASCLGHDASRLLHVDLAWFAFQFGEATRYGRNMVERLGPPRLPSAPLEDRHRHAARGIQTAVERWAEDALRHECAQRPSAGNVGVAGGLFLNCALVGVLQRALQVPIHPFPVAGDAGAAWGAAAHVYEQLAGTRAAPLGSLRLGTEIGSAEVDETCRGRKASAHLDVTALAAAVVDRLARGRIVGVARGRSELGPRALGGRSVLALPRSIEVRDEVNRRKGREAWRPLAPIVREGDDSWFEGLQASPYMIRTFRATARARREAPGIVHVDGTARVQTVGSGADDDAFLGQLLAGLAARGLPDILLNTSLNRPGEPLVERAREALATAEAIGLDALVLGDRLLELSPDVS